MLQSGQLPEVKLFKVCIYPTHLLYVGYDTISIFKSSAAGRNKKFSFS